MALLVRASVPGTAAVDVRCEAGRITEVGRGLRRAPGETEIDARGGAVLPGLHDHHLHVAALAAADRSVPVGPAAVGDGAAMAQALRARAAGLPAGGWIRAVGYHGSVAGDLDRDRLDQMVDDRPVRVQHRSGALWVLNSAALGAVGVGPGSPDGVERDAAGRPTGRLWRLDGWLADRLGPGSAGPGHADLRALSDAGVAVGVTGWTDATPERAAAQTELLVGARAAGAIRQRLHLMVPADPGAWPAPGSVAVRGVSTGPVKVMLDDRDLPTLDELAGRITTAHRGGRAVAVHCVTLVQLALTMVALDTAGPRRGDRIEHGALISADWIARIAGAGVVVVTQPTFVAERGDQYHAEVPVGDLPDLWRGRSLVDGGVTVAAGSDAPFGSPDPWAGIRAAVRRRTVGGRVLGDSETVAPHVAVGWWAGTAADPGRRRRVEPGEPADLVVLAAPLGPALTDDGPVPVRATVLDGEVVSGG